MSLSQGKVDLIVLYKLHQRANQGGHPIPVWEVQSSIELSLPVLLVEFALKALRDLGEVEELDNGYGGAIWQITRAGFQKVERALKVPASFIARLHANGDEWLGTEEAEAAILQKLPSKKNPEQNTSENASVVINNLISNENKQGGSEPHTNWFRTEFIFPLLVTMLGGLWVTYCTTTFDKNANAEADAPRVQTNQQTKVAPSPLSNPTSPKSSKRIGSSTTHNADTEAEAIGTPNSNSVVSYNQSGGVTAKQVGTVTINE